MYKPNKGVYGVNFETEVKSYSKKHLGSCFSNLYDMNAFLLV